VTLRAHAISRLLGAVAIAFALAGTAVAHPGHDDGPPAPSTAAPRAIAHSDIFDLVAVLGPDGRLWLYLDRYATAEPVDNAAIEATIDGQPVAVSREGDAVYVLSHPTLGQPGLRNLVFTVTAGADMDLLPVSIEVPATAIAAAAGPGTRQILLTAAQEPIAWAAALGLLVIGMLIGRAAAPRALPPMVVGESDSERHVVARATTVPPAPARARAAAAALVIITAAVPAAAQPMDAPRRQPDGSVFLPKPTQRLFGLRTVLVERSEAPVAVQLVGQVIADPNASGRVQAPQAGRVEPPPGGFPALGSRVERGQVLAYVVPVLAAQERSGVQATLAELDSQIGIAQQRAQRLAALAGSVSAREITEARAELDGLRARRAAVAEGLNGRLPVQATATGVLSTVAAVGGQIVDAREPLFEIVDPARLWVEAIAFDSAQVADITGAQATTSAGASLDLVFVGRGLTLRQQAVPLQFRITDPAPGLSVGTPVTVIVQTPRRSGGIVLPSSAVIRSAEGPPIIFEMSSAERFVPRQVRMQPLDGRNVLVVAGVERSARIVTEAASLVAQVR
jgi:hypothetical protein